MWYVSTSSVENPQILSYSFTGDFWYGKQWCVKTQIIIHPQMFQNLDQYLSNQVT